MPTPDPYLSPSIVAEFAIPGGPIPSNICSAPDGSALWASLEGGVNKVAKIAYDGTITQYTVGSPGDNFGGINPGPDGKIWLTDFVQNTIIKIDPGNGSVIATYAAGTTGIGGICNGSDGNMWFMDTQGGKVGKITPAGVITLYSPAGLLSPHGPNLGADGNVWFCGLNSNDIWKITPAGVATKVATVPTAGSQPYVINQGNDGNLWFTEITGNKIAKITYAGVITEYALSTANSKPGGICPGPGDGNVWFVEKNNNKIGYITPTGTITELTVPTAGSNPDKIVARNSGGSQPNLAGYVSQQLWFTEHDTFKVGYAAIPPPRVVYPTKVALTARTQSVAITARSQKVTIGT